MSSSAGRCETRVTPYASLQPETSSFEEYLESMVEWANRAVAAGFRAIKAEVTLRGPVRAHRPARALGPQYSGAGGGAERDRGRNALLVDVQYAFPDADTALAVMRDWVEFDLVFVETPLWPDDLDGHRRLAAEQPIPIASGEWLTTRFEHIDLMDRGRCPFRPAGHRTGRWPDRGPSRLRPGGGAWAAHLPASVEDGDLDRRRAAPRGSDTQLRLHRIPAGRARRVWPRQDLTDHRLKMVDGVLPLPTEPGLGIELDRTALAAYADEAEAVSR